MVGCRKHCWIEGQGGGSVLDFGVCRGEGIRGWWLFGVGRWEEALALRSDG